ncbi:hypothetical protein [Nocardioides sp.]|uniref:hypothetical protein n=1 Tax=Nocardioides sp. TaxID=35761 RepID=UPI0027286ACE|nr:hypothetical protein [Nocardioides sp.]MDO9456599.1 hypothetical protein [Nocardioides sp.]
MQDADEAERRGDVAGALEVIMRRPLDQNGDLFWRLERIRRLRQLDELAPVLPAWVTSRWILTQATQIIDDRDPGARSRRLRALDVAQELSGLDADEASSVSLMDHDWFYRQVLLWEEGALGEFLSRSATPDLVAGADRIAEWAAAPMGGFVYLGAAAGRSRWTDLATGEVLTLDDIGSGSMLAPDVPAIGRLVPAGDGRMFESAPQETSLDVATAVAADPAGWLDVVRAAGDEFRCGEIIPHVDDFGLVTDVARMQWLTWLAEWRPARGQALQVDDQLLARTVVDRAARELGLSEHRYLPPGEDYDAEEQEGWEPWACLGAALLEPGLSEALRAVVTTGDLGVLDQLRDRVADPARSLLGQVIASVQQAA